MSGVNNNNIFNNNKNIPNTNMQNAKMVNANMTLYSRIGIKVNCHCEADAYKVDLGLRCFARNDRVFYKVLVNVSPIK